MVYPVSPMQKEKNNITEEEVAKEVDPRLVQVYTEVGKFLKRYKSGALPKVVKILPGLSNWEEVCVCVCARACVCMFPLL